MPQTTWQVYYNLNILWNYLEEQFISLWNYDDVVLMDEREQKYESFLANYASFME